MLASFAKGDATLEQQSANLVDHCGTAHHPPFAHSVQRLKVELVVGLDRHEAYTRTCDGFGNRFSIDVVVLVGLHIRLHVLGRHQPHVMSLFAQGTAQEMRSTASLHADQALAKVRCETKQLSPRALLANHNFTAYVDSNKVKDRLP